MFMYFEIFASSVLLDFRLVKYNKVLSGEYCYFYSVPRDVSVSEYYSYHNLLLKSPFCTLIVQGSMARGHFLYFGTNVIN